MHAKFIFENFEARGDTESFNIYSSDLERGNLNAQKLKDNIKPSEIRHKTTATEQSFTSTGDKLAYHWPIFKKYGDTGYGSIIRATMTLHQVCSSHCHYCSTIGRNKKDSISLDEAKKFVTHLYDEQANFNRATFKEYNDLYKSKTGSEIRLRGLVLSGGGQPNLWPYFEEFVEWLSTKNIELGLITNGFPTKISENIYKKFKWIRISITPEDASPHYPEKKFNKQYIPKSIISNKDITVGYSYVYGAWTDLDILKRIDDSINLNGFTYCRLLTDCNLPRSSQLRSHAELAEILFNNGYINSEGLPLKKLFHQLKYHASAHEADSIWNDGQCQLQVYNVFWDTTGHESLGKSKCYSCDSITVLAEEGLGEVSNTPSERKFNPDKWGLVTNDLVSDLFTKPVAPYFDPRKICTACLFTQNNLSVKKLSSINNYNSIDISSNLIHANFP